MAPRCRRTHPGWSTLDSLAGGPSDGDGGRPARAWLVLAAWVVSAGQAPYGGSDGSDHEFDGPEPPAPGPAPWWRRWPTSRVQRILAWLAVITNGGIAVTGATVRVTGSGLGCPTWPQCSPGSLVPVSRSGMAAFHQAIEFTNRTLTGVVLIPSLGIFLALPGLADPAVGSLVKLAAVLPAGVLLQAVWGGITVRTGLAWWTVAPTCWSRSRCSSWPSPCWYGSARPTTPRSRPSAALAAADLGDCRCPRAALRGRHAGHGRRAARRRRCDATARSAGGVTGAGPCGPDVHLFRSAGRADRGLPWLSGRLEPSSSGR